MRTEIYDRMHAAGRTDARKHNATHRGVFAAHVIDSDSLHCTVGTV